MNEIPASVAPQAAAGPPATTPEGVQAPARLRPGDVLRGFSRIRRTSALYGKDHPVIGRLVDDGQRLVESLLRDRPSLTFFIHEETFFADNAMLLEESLQISSLLVEFKKRNILSIEIHRGLQPQELRRFVDMLNIPAADLQRLGGAGAYLGEHGVTHIVAGSVQANPVLPRGGLSVDPHDAYRAGLRVMDELYSQASRATGIDLRKANVVVNSLIDLLTNDQYSLMGTATIKNYDQDTCHHSVNVGILSLFMATRLEFDRDLAYTLGLAALLHDIGKVRVPIEILNKAGKFTAEERDIMQQHPVYGARLLQDLPDRAKLAMVVAFEHHANYDLSGYPRIATKKQQHLLARIVQIVDVFDAATSARRIYRRPMPPEDAIRLIQEGAGTLFDPVLARLFMHAIGLYPVGTLVQLDTGELAVVRQPGKRDAARPSVSVIDPLAPVPTVARAVHLEEEPDRRIVRSRDPIAAGLNPRAYLALSN